MNLNLRLLFIVCVLISSCHEKDYNVLLGAKKIILNNDTKEEIKEKEDKIKQLPIEAEKKEIIDVDETFEDKKKFSQNKEKTKKQTSRILKDIESSSIDKTSSLKENNEKALIDNSFINDETIKIGVMLPLTGKNKNIGNMILNAIEMAIFQNKNSKLELLIKDTEAKPDKAKKVFIELVNEKANIVIGPLFSKTLAAVQGLSNTYNINILALTNNKNLARKGVWVFGIDPQAQTEKILKLALENGSKKIAALLPKNAYGLLLFDTISNFSEENLLDIEKIEFYESSIDSQRNASKKISIGFDKYQDFLNKLKDEEKNQNILEESVETKKPFDSVFIAATGQNLTVLASQLQYNNVDPKIVQYLGISSWEDKSILREPALEGGIFVTTSQLYQKKIKLIYKKSFNKDMPKIAMIAYDILALLNSLDTKGNNINISEMINVEGYSGLRGVFRLKENGIVERTFALKQVKNKKFRIYKKAKNTFSDF